MADDKKGGAKSEAGQLFIDFGSTGLGTLIKGLNSISASFLLAKNAAKQMSDMIIKPAQEAGNTAVNIGKIASALGTSYKEVQKMQMYLKSKSASEDLINDIANVKTIIQDVQTGFADLPAGVSVALSRTGHNITEYSESFEDILRLFDDIREATNSMDADARNQILRQLGISSEWGYLWDRGDFNIREASLISDEAIEKNIEASEAMAQLAVTTENLKIELVAKIAPALTTIANWLTNHEINFKSGKYDNTIKTTTNTVKTTAVNSMMATPVGVVTITGASLVGAGKGLIQKANETKNGTSKKGVPTGGASSILPLINIPSTPIDNSNIPTPENIQNSQDVPSQMYQNLTQTTHIEITNQNTINGENAREIAQQIASINSQDIEYNQFQTSNLAGL